MRTKFTYISVRTKSGNIYSFKNGYFVKGEDHIFIDAEYRIGERNSFVIYISELEILDWFYKTDEIEKENKDENY